MLDAASRDIIESSRSLGWVLEPRAKALLAAWQMDIPRGIETDSLEAACRFLDDLGARVVIKAVSGQILHKTEHNAVITGIRTREELTAGMSRLLTLPGCDSVLVEEMVSGIEVMVGAKNDVQFGPVVLLGPGGISVELYRDTAIRLSPVTPADVRSMVDSLAAAPLFHGFRGRHGVNMDVLTRLMVNFSRLTLDLELCFESMDLNPVICSPDRCVVADARILLLPE